MPAADGMAVNTYPTKKTGQPRLSGARVLSCSPSQGERGSTLTLVLLVLLIALLVPLLIALLPAVLLALLIPLALLVFLA